MDDMSVYLENIIDQCGGLGFFQILLITFILGSKLIPTCSMLMMTFAGATPDWYCRRTETGSFFNATNNVTDQKCTVNHTTCSNFRFDDNMDTIVNEWDLVCDKDWIPDTITTVQMGGLFVGGLLSGHIADAIGRKPTYFMSLATLLVVNVCAGLSVSWQMFAVFRFMIGVGCAFYLTVFYTFLLEFMPKRQRPLILGIPSWPIWAVAFAFTSKWLHNWQYLHFAIAILTVPWFLAWWIVPESFRWLVMRRKVKSAEEVIKRLSKINRKPVPNLKEIGNMAEEEIKKESTKKTYSLLDLMKTPELRRITLLLGVGWMSCGYGYYAISFGVENLSGDLYLNMFLLSVVEIPAQMITYFTLNWFGRKWSGVGFLTIAGIGGLIVGGLQVSDLEDKDRYINGFAMMAKLGVAAGWVCLQILTTENYPTVVRNIGYGAQNSLSRVGGMIAPQFVYLNKHHVPGILYFLFGAVMLLTALCTGFVPETKGKAMPDEIQKSKSVKLKLVEDKYQEQMETNQYM